MKTLVLMSGGMDSLACMLYTLKYKKPEDVISLGVNYGQRHFDRENEAAWRFCLTHNIRREVLQIPLDQIGGSSLTDHSKPVTTDMTQQRSTVVPQRNAILLLFASAFAEVNGCDEIVHGAIKEDFNAYRDCRFEFFRLLEASIQAGRTQPIKGSEKVIDDLCVDWKFKSILSHDKIDVHIKTPLIDKTKIEVVKDIVEEFGMDIYNYSYTCYNGGELSCGKCPACQERLEAFRINGLVDPIEYIKE